MSLAKTAQIKLISANWIRLAVNNPTITVADIISIIAEFGNTWRSQWILTNNNKSKMEISSDNPLQVHCKPGRIPPRLVNIQDPLPEFDCSWIVKILQYGTAFIGIFSRDDMNNIHKYGIDGRGLDNRVYFDNATRKMDYDAYNKKLSKDDIVKFDWKHKQSKLRIEIKYLSQNDPKNATVSLQLSEHVEYNREWYIGVELYNMGGGGGGCGTIQIEFVD